jgi:superfamily II DNA or RNA helicase
MTNPIAEIYNDIIRISNAPLSLIQDIESKVSYVDKSKQYQLQRMRRSMFNHNSIKMMKLEAESKGSLLSKISEDNDVHTVEMPSGFAYLLSDISNIDVKDFRLETGSTIALPWASKAYSFQLRDYQEEALANAIGNWRGIVNFATGLGKTKTAIAIIKNLKRKTLIVCPGKKLAYQFKEELEQAFGANNVGIVGDNKFKLANITVGIAQSIANKAEQIKSKIDFGVVIFDETHHTPASTFYEVAQSFGKVGRIYGLTATAYRSDGKDIFMHAACGAIISERDVAWGVANEWLAQPYFIVRSIDTDGQDFKDDKLKNYKNHVLKNQKTNNRLISDICAMVKAKKSTLVLVDQIEHGDLLSTNTGLPFANGKDKGSDSLIDALNKGTIPGLIATDGIVGEGIDTRNVDCLVLANFNASKVAVMQAVGRGLRKTKTKDKCIVLDYKLTGSSMLSRHCDQRVSYYKEITSNVKLV